MIILLREDDLMKWLEAAKRELEDLKFKDEPLTENLQFTEDEKECLIYMVYDNEMQLEAWLTETPKSQRRKLVKGP